MAKMLKRWIAWMLAVVMLWTGVAALAQEIAILLLPSQLSSIGDEAFSGNTSIEKVVVPEGTRYIGSRAFADSSIAEIELPDTVEEIADDAFSGCGEGLVISAPEGSYAYDWAVEMGYIEPWTPSPAMDFSYTISDGEVMIMGYSGSDTQIVIPQEINGYPVTGIGEYAFCYDIELKPDNSESLHEVTAIKIPDTVASIGQGAFQCCYMLAEMEIPDSVEYLGSNAFRYCENLVEVQLSQNLTLVEEGLFDSCFSLASVELPDGIGSIGALAFYNCVSLESISIPDGVSYIGSNAFESCASLRSIEMPSDLMMIDSFAFAYCARLTGIEIPGKVMSIGEAAFCGCLSLTEIEIPAGVETIGGYAFEGCESLGSAAIPPSVSSIGESAFDGCASGLVIYGAAGSSAESYANENGHAFIEMDFPAPEEDFIYTISDGECTITKYTGSDTKVITPETIEGFPVAAIGNDAFAVNTSLEQIEISEGVVSIGDSAFSNCKNLVSVGFPSTLKSIGNYAFTLCSKLEDVALPASLRTMGDGAFYGGDSLKTIRIPYGVRELGASAFAYSYALESIELPATLERVGDNAFSNCAALKEIQLPVQVTHIGAGVFMGCSQLTKAVVYSNATSIGESAFSYCSDALVIYGEADSHIEDYANEYMIEFSELELSTDKVTVSGGVTLVDGTPMEGVQVFAINHDQHDALTGYASTDESGEWMLMLTAGESYTIVYRHADYNMDPASCELTADADTILDTAVALVTDGSGSAGVDFTMLMDGAAIPDAGIRAGDTIEIQIAAPAAEKVRMIVGGVIYEEYALENGTISIERRFTQSGIRTVCFQAYDGAQWGAISDPQMLVVSADGDLAPAAIHGIDTQYVNNAFRVSWDAVEHADTYAVYLYHQKLLWPALNDTSVSTTSNLYMDIPGDALYTGGEYTIEVVAAGHGYNQSSAWLNFTVEETSRDVAISYPAAGTAYAIGSEMHTKCITGNGVSNVKLLVAPPAGDPVFCDPDSDGLFHPLADQVGTYVLTPYYAYRDGDFSMDGGYDGCGESITVEVHAPELAYLQRGEDTQYSHMYTDTAFSFEGELEIAEHGLRIYLGDTLLKTVEPGEGTAFRYDVSALVNTGAYYFCFEPFWGDVAGDKVRFPVYAVERMTDSRVRYVSAEINLQPRADADAGIALQYGEEVTLLGTYSDVLVYGESRGYYGFFRGECLVETIEIGADSILSVTASNTTYCPIGSQLRYIVGTTEGVDSITAKVCFRTMDYYAETSYSDCVGVRNEANANEFFVDIPVEATGLYTCYFSARSASGDLLSSFMVTEFLGIDDGMENAGEKCYSTFGDISLVHVPGAAGQESGMIDPRISAITCIGYIHADAYANMYMLVKYQSLVDGSARFGVIYSEDVQFEVNEAERTVHIIATQNVLNDANVSAFSLDAIDMVYMLFQAVPMEFDTASIHTHKYVTKDTMNALMQGVIRDTDYNDEVYVYIISHGYIRSGTTGIVYDNGAVAETGEGCISNRDFAGNVMAKIEGKSVWMLQPCHSGGIVSEARQLGLDPSRTSIIASSLIAEVSRGSDSGSGTLFVEKFIETCTKHRPLADADNNSEISLGEIKDACINLEISSVNGMEYEHVDVFGLDNTRIF